MNVDVICLCGVAILLFLFIFLMPLKFAMKLFFSFFSWCVYSSMSSVTVSISIIDYYYILWHRSTVYHFQLQKHNVTIT